MPQLDWAIDIVQAGTIAAFQPKLPNTAPGMPLRAQPNDIVTWGNRTSQTHQPWPLVNGAPAPGETPAGYMSDPIPTNQSSRPQFVVKGTVGSVINYCCKLHPGERGQITIVTL